MADLFLFGLAAHLVADWFLQNEYLAKNKVDLRHPAAWIHSGIQFACLSLVFPLYMAAILGLVHILIDTRKPLVWWRQLLRQTNDPANPVFIPFTLAQDQAFHVLCLIVAAWWVMK
jgi:hypothetical protein